METTRRLADLLSDIEGITLRGAADLCIVAFETTLGDIYVLVDFMTTKVIYGLAFYLYPLTIVVFVGLAC